MPLCGHKIETTTDHFGDMVRKNCLLVDKTLMVKDFWQGQQVSLILRPRRFGKTLNLSMLQHFFAAEVNGQATQGLFDAFAIAKEDNGQWIAHQGQYPVIFISFKDVKQASYVETVNSIKLLVAQLYREHRKLLSISNDDYLKQSFRDYLTGTVDDEKLASSLRFLSEFIFNTLGKKPIILIDEYDTPLTHGYQSHFIDEISLFLRNLLSAALKSNPYLEKGLMTGILRVSKNELLSGLNNIAVYTLFDDDYSQYFGFTEEEAAELTTRIPTQDSPEAIKAFYNGYRIGDRVIYNPWSFMNYLHKKTLAPYWVLTSGDHVLKKLFLQADADTKAQLSRLMNHEVITANISLKTSYEDLMESPQVLWTLLLFAGYLTANSKTLLDDGLVCALRVPNREIIAQYRSIFSQWLTQTFGESRYQSFLTSLVCGDIARFTEVLGEYLMNSLSFRDVGDKKGENFYHGFVAGLVASIGETHWVDSNKESGRGLYDVMLTPKDLHHTQGIVFEFKHVQGENMNDAALKALKQIQRFDYASLLRRYSHITHIVKVGLAFSGKAVSSVYTTEIVATGEEGELIWTYEK